MSVIHPAERPVRACIKGGLRFGQDQGILSDADLDSTAAAAKADVAIDNAKLHVSQRLFGPRVDASLDRINDYDSTYLAGGDVDKATMLAIEPTFTQGRTVNF